VAYISGRADMMSAAFLFAGLLATALRGSTVRRIAAALLCGLCFLGGLFSKESAAIFPLLLLLVLWLRVRQDGHTYRGWKEYLPQIAGTIAGGIVYFIVRSGADLPAAQQAEAAGLGTRLVEVGQSLALYVHMLFWPAGLHMERTLDGVPGVISLLGYAFLAAMIAAIFWGVRNRQPQVAAAFLWFMITWFPISGIFPLNAPLAEHWLYVPMAGFWWGLGLLLLHLRASTVWQRTLAAATAILVTSLGVAAIERNEDWHDNTRLYEATLAENPNTSRVNYNLAVTHENLTGNSAGARRHFQRAASLGLATANPDVMLSLGETLFTLGRYQEAYTWFARLFATTGPAATPFKPAAAAGIGRCYLALGYFNPASSAFQGAIQLEPGRAAQIRAWEAGAPL
jgi:tetratricopeptide (TPR) repeat protein